MSNNARKVCVVTGSRAEYGLLYWVLRGIQEHASLQLQLIVTGMHLSDEFGSTYRAIEEDGFEITAKVDCSPTDDSALGVTKSLGMATIGFAEAFQRLQPDIVLLFGDRYEQLAAAQAALIARIPAAHLHGGEVTSGAFDEAMRHSITKMAHLHFVAAGPYRQRVIQLGEDSQRVFNVGTTAFDNIRKSDLLSRDEFEEAIGFPLGKTNFLITYHPATLQDKSPERPTRELLQSLDSFPDARLIFTRTNSDTRGRIINTLLEEYVEANAERARIFSALGTHRYMSAVKYVDVVVGNSSSGLIEVPFLQTATVNIGNRQAGRLRASSVIDCEEHAQSIHAAIEQALSAEFQQSLANVQSPYGTGNASEQIVAELAAAELEGIVVKKFCDIQV